MNGAWGVRATGEGWAAAGRGGQFPLFPVTVLERVEEANHVLRESCDRSQAPKHGRHPCRCGARRPRRQC
eukprot:1414747-Pyramimonas_sp.AAC.1